MTDNARCKRAFGFGLLGNPKNLMVITIFGVDDEYEPLAQMVTVLFVAALHGGYSISDGDLISHVRNQMKRIDFMDMMVHDRPEVLSKALHVAKKIIEYGQFPLEEPEFSDRIAVIETRSIRKIDVVTAYDLLLDRCTKSTS